MTAGAAGSACDSLSKKSTALTISLSLVAIIFFELEEKLLEKGSGAHSGDLAQRLLDDEQRILALERALARVQQSSLATGKTAPAPSVVPTAGTAPTAAAAPAPAPALAPTSAAMAVVNGHVPVADGYMYLPQEYPLPSLNGRIPFPDADYGDCQPFTVPHGRVYGKLQPSQDDHVGHRWPGRVFVRCNRGFELRSGSNPDRMCLNVEGASSWSPGGGDWANSICVAATPAMLSPTATFGQNEHLRCLAGLVKSFPAAGGMPAGRSNDHRVAALECLGCRRVPSNVDNDCSVSGRLFELADVDCNRLETLGSASSPALSLPVRCAGGWGGLRLGRRV